MDSNHCTVQVAALPDQPLFSVLLGPVQERDDCSKHCVVVLGSISKHNNLCLAAAVQFHDETQHGVREQKRINEAQENVSTRRQTRGQWKMRRRSKVQEAPSKEREMVEECEMRTHGKCQQKIKTMKNERRTKMRRTIKNRMTKGKKKRTSQSENGKK